TISHIADINPGTFSSLTEKFLIYTPGNSYDQFIVYTASLSSNQYDVILDYIIIEEICESNFAYSYNTTNVQDVTFYPPYNPGQIFTWTPGDGTSNNNSTM